MRKHQRAAPAPRKARPAIDALKHDRRFATTLVSGLELLRCFTSVEGMLGNKELAERTGLPKATVSRLSFTLAALGYLRRNQRLGKYELGPAVLTLGYPLLANLRARFIGRQLMRELTDHTAGQTSMALRHDLEAVYVESFRPEEDWINRPEIGTTRPVMRTAIGHALLFAATLEEREQVFELHRKREPQRWRADQAAVSRSLRQIAEQGFYSIWGSYRKELWALGAPMKRAAGSEAIAFNLSLLAHRTTRTKMTRDYGPRLVGLVRSVESTLGLG